ncbi:MAG TPA: hypothetical protein VHZ09_03375 [Acidobacteriaceae bacterium]|jgi:hypothetical protein|nr:hypothetical protein [Acidobacteriaceae bacterium]
MNNSISWWERQIAVCLALLLTVPLGLAATDDLPHAPQPVPAAASRAPQPSSGQGSAAPQETGSDSLIALAQNGQNQNPGQDQTQQPASGQTPPPASQQPRQPVGTAAAPYIGPGGVPASRPAGAAIAPAKQRRVRIYAIRIALLVGAAVAVGTVVGASEASSSRP